MAVFNSLVFLLSLFVASNALATPHVVRHHRAIAARVALPAPLDLPLVPLRKRQNSRRCKQRSSSIDPSSSIPVVASTPAVVKPTSTRQAPSPSTTRAQAPRPTTTQAPSPSTRAQAPRPTTTQRSSGGSSSNLPSFMVGTQTGQGTFYSTGLGACGITNQDTDYIAAVSHLLFDNFPGYKAGNPNNNPMCGRRVIATYRGKSVTVALTDRCAGCAITDLDFSPSAFNQLADFGVGRISGVTWVWA